MAVLRANGNGGAAYLQKNFAAAGDVYMDEDCSFDGTLSLRAIGAMLNSGTIRYGVEYDGGSGVWSDQYETGDTAALPLPQPLGSFQTLRTHWQNNLLTEAWVDGVPLWSEAFADPVNIDAVRVGSTGAFGFEGIVYIDNVKVGTTPGGSEIFSDDFESLSLAGWDSAVGDVAIIDARIPTPRIGPPSYEWRFVVTKLNLRVLSFFDKLARDKNVTYTLNKAATATGVVPSDDPEVYLVQSDGFPLLEEGVRCLLGFRREKVYPAADPWVIRFAGIIQGLEDNVDENGGVAPYSTFTAYDPRQLLYSRPIRRADGSFPGAAGLTFTGETGDAIALELLARTLAADGEHFMDVDSGTIETTDVISSVNFQPGTSVGEAWDQLTDSGNLDIVLTALYDPVGTPNKLAVFNAYSLAGTTRHKAVMAWDRPSRSLVGVNRLKDGTQRANRVRYTGADGVPAGTESDFAAAVQYGDYWAQQSFPGKSAASAELLAAEQLLIRAKGIKSYKLNPVPGSLGQIDSPLLFLDYFLGDVLPIYASSRLRHEIEVGKRVISIPVNIADDATERIEQLELGEGEVEVS